MTETTITPPVEETHSEEECCVLEYEILERNGTSLSVKFINPNWVGDFVEEENPDTGEVTEFDKDPNLHITKNINVPLNEDGSVNLVELKSILHAQAHGAKHRMDAAASMLIDPNETELDDLIGAVL